ncbi:MAG TPA: MFS transporter [Bacillota bacterium]|nr:MFS transporter [Bacillota bacterium]
MEGKNETEVFRRRQFFLFLTALALMGTMSGIYENTFNNYLSDVYHLSEQARGFLEFPRELPGFLVAVFSGLLFFLPVERLGALAVAGIGVGLIGQAFLAPSYGWVILWMVIWSWGTHLFLPLQSTIGLSFSEEGQFGRRLGQLQGINTAALIVGCGLVWLLFRGLRWSYTGSFTVAACFAFAAAAILYILKPHKETVKRTRFVLKKKYTRFYLLNVIWGARKQVFLTFAPWVLVKIYHQPPTTFATIILIAASVAVVLQPMLGRAIDHFGERKIFIVEGLGMLFICLGYATAAGVFGKYALYALFIFYMLDRFMMDISMARATYLRKIIEDPADLTPTLSMGVTMDHAVSMTVPALGGLLWAWLGYPAVFIAAALISVGNLTIAWRLNIQKNEADQEAA